MNVYNWDLIFPKIIEQLQNGKSLRAICLDPKMPNASTVCNYVDSNEEAAKLYARARELQADYYADQIVEIADDEIDPQKARNRIDARKWIAGKLRPRRYGDKIQQEVSGPDGTAAILQIVTRVK